MTFPRTPLGSDHFQGLGNIAGDAADPLVVLLNAIRDVAAAGAYHVDPNRDGAFPTIADAVGQAAEDIPTAGIIPKRIVPISLAPTDHEVDIDLPKTHSFYFFVPGYPVETNSNPPGGRIHGRIGVEKYQQTALPNSERTHVGFANVSLGRGIANDLILEAFNGWKWYFRDVLFYGSSWRASFDPGMLGFESAIHLLAKTFKFNAFQEFKFLNSGPGGASRPLIRFERGSAFGIPDTPSRYFLDGDFFLELVDVEFLGLTNPGTTFDAAPGTSGTITFNRTFWDWLGFGGALALFSANMGAMTFEWLGRNVFTEAFSFGPITFDLGGNIGTHVLAPELIGPTVPSNPPVGTRRRDVGGTEVDLFWNGVGWV